MAAPTVSAKNTSEDDDHGAVTYHLLVLGPEHTATHPLPAQGSMSIGRAEEADVRVVDPLASRYHARLHVLPENELAIEDLDSANGTSLRDRPMPPRQRLALAPGEAVTIGSTVLVVQRREPEQRSRRLWPHGYFETRLIEECARAESVKGAFAVLRLHAEAADARRCEALLAAAIRPGDVLAVYGPNEYEVLLLDTGRTQAEVVVADLVRLLERDGITSGAGVAFFPGDGTSPQALVTCACGRVRAAGRPEVSPATVLENRAMRELYAMAERAAKGNINVLILGETGVGKELLAETVHRLSPRAPHPLLCLNCAALSESLLESELFGHEKGAFTGAAQAKPGLLEAASGGTLFLDEVGEMPLTLQAKVLRAIETRMVLRVGATKPRAVDVRFVAATNRDLEEEVAAKRFREDLYFRLNGIALTIPPLRERRDEIEPLARRFLAGVAEQSGRPPPALSAEALALLQVYLWPGNIRELRNVVERAFLLCAGAEILAQHLPAEKMRPAAPAAAEEPAAPPAAVGALTMREIERQAILDALSRCAGNQTRAAERLGMPRRTFCTKLKEHNIPRPRTS